MAAYQGTLLKQVFKLKDKSGTAIDITGWTFKADLRTNVEDEVAALTLESGAGFSIVDGPNGRLEMAITAEQMSELDVGTYVFDVLRTDANPGPIWLFAGKIKPKKPVTRP